MEGGNDGFFYVVVILNYYFGVGIELMVGDQVFDCDVIGVQFG